MKKLVFELLLVSWMGRLVLKQQWILKQREETETEKVDKQKQGQCWSIVSLVLLEPYIFVINCHTK